MASKLRASLSELGPLLREARLRRGLRHADVADACVISRPQVSNIEAGRTSISLSALQQVASALGFTLVLELVDVGQPLPKFVEARTLAAKRSRVKKAEAQAAKAEQNLARALAELA